MIALRAFAADAPLQFSGRYPHLAMFNDKGECGTGAVAPWAGRLWVITYAPQEMEGSRDKLYEIDPDLNRVIRPESVGGTPADRMIHRESDQLIIGPYVIDSKGSVRVIPPSVMPGRLTAAARHLSDPANKVYVYDMEGTLYEVDVHTLAVKKLFARAAPGAHGKGAYTAQGRLVVSNNGQIVMNTTPPAAKDLTGAKDPEAAGALAEWDGTTWRLLQRRQFTEVTGPGGIDGSPTADAPLWALGWDKRSVLLELLDGGAWHSFRLPVADYSYVARHGWYTEWPRIREVTGGKLLMNMHGQWFDFPKSFSAANTAGIRPLGSYLKITGDFCAWNDRIVFGCDDASLMENPLCAQSQSNLWFSTWDGLSKCGAPAGFGGPWLDDEIKAGEPSDPYLFAGYAQRVVHLSHDSDQPVTFTLELDADGKGNWSPADSVTVPPHGYAWHIFPPDMRGEWIRLKTDRDCKATAYFHYGPGGGAVSERAMFASLRDAADQESAPTARLYPTAGDRGTLLLQSEGKDMDGLASRTFEVGADLQFRAYEGKPMGEPKTKSAAADYNVRADEASLIVSDGKNRYRLPAADSVDASTASQRSIREVVTERFLLNAGGSFFMLPRPTADGPSRIKPICTHDKRIDDFCSWRGILVLAGCRPDAKPDSHYVAAPGGNAGLWFGDIDDLWKLGKPRGEGGPWSATSVMPDQPSDPYLMAGYDHKTMELSHDSPGTVHVTVEVDIAANGSWQTFRTFEVPAGQTTMFEFPSGYSAQWIRARCDTACRATMKLAYD